MRYDRRQNMRQNNPKKRLTFLLLPSIIINLLIVALLRPDEVEIKKDIHELEIIAPEKKRPNKAQKNRQTPPIPRPHVKPKKRIAKREKERPERKEDQSADPPIRYTSTPSPQMKMRSDKKAKPAKSRFESFGKPKYDIKTYADGGRLVTNRSQKSPNAPERKNFWRTQKAPRNDAARLSLSGLASMLAGGRYGKVCNHFKRFVSSTKDRTVYLLIDSSPSMSDNMSPAELCAVSIAQSALDKKYPVVVGRFGQHTICHPKTTNSSRIRDIIVSQKRIGGTLVPSTCGANEDKKPLDIIIITDGGFFNADIIRMLEAKSALKNKKSRGMIYLLKDPRFEPNPQTMYAFRTIGYQVVKFDNPK